MTRQRTGRQRTAGRFRPTAALILLVLSALSGCTAGPLLHAGTGRLQVVTTTGILRDLVSNVAGDRADVVSLVPDNGDPHTYEPTLRDARNVVYADVAFSNYAMLEEQGVIRTLDANLQDEALNVSLAEESVKYAAELIPLVENVDLDTVWLGLRALGDGARYGADRTSQVLLSAVAASGPGDMFAYLTGSFGEIDEYFDSSDGFDPATGYRDDTMSLPVAAHTHLSWAFTEPGIYTLTLSARLQVERTSRPTQLATETFTFAVGVDPAQAGMSEPVVLDEGHADLTVNLDTGRLEVLHDPSGGGTATQVSYPGDRVVIDVPAKALEEIPADPQYAFLGHPGEPVYQLAQAVLGKHVHGEIDPHLWQDVRNAMAYTQLIRDTLIAADPEGATTYTANADAYLDVLERTDDYVRATIASIPASRRHLITTHDAFGYLANAYDLTVAGFVSPNPATEPSLADRRKLTRTIETLGVPAVFLEPNLAARSSTLTEVAAEQGIQVCSIYGDSFDATVTTYVQMMRFNAESLHRCLSTGPTGTTGATTAGSTALGRRTPTR